MQCSLQTSYGIYPYKTPLLQKKHWKKIMVTTSTFFVSFCEGMFTSVCLQLVNITRKTYPHTVLYMSQNQSYHAQQVQLISSSGREQILGLHADTEVVANKAVRWLNGVLTVVTLSFLEPLFILEQICTMLT